jgi:hypothetical protein
MLETNLLWPDYSLSRTIEICCTQHLYQQNSFAVKSVVHSGMTFLPGRPLEPECIRGAQDVRRMVPSDLLLHNFISVTVATMHLTLHVAALTFSDNSQVVQKLVKLRLSLLHLENTIRQARIRL